MAWSPLRNPRLAHGRKSSPVRNVIMDNPASHRSQQTSPADYAFDAFISYATEDRRLASRLQVFLQRFRTVDGRSLRVYLDETHIRGGNLTQELRTALETSAALIVVCSRAAAGSTWVGREIGLFLQREQPRIALVLGDDDPIVAIPTSLRSFEIRFHDLRAGTIATVWKPRARNELLRLVAWLTDANLSTLINWERRRLIKNSAVGLGVLLLPVTAVYRYAARRRPIEPSDIALTVVLSWIDEEGTGRGGAIDQTMLNSPTLLLDILPRSDASVPPPWKWPTNARGSTAMESKPVHLGGQLESHQLRSSPSTAGVWYESTRTFRIDATSLGPLSDIDEWDGAVAAVVYSALGLGSNWPPLDGVTEDDRKKELTAEALRFYAIHKAQWENMDYSMYGVPVKGDLTLFLRNRPVATAKAKAVRVWEHDEDARDLHALVFKPFRLSPKP